MDKIKFSLPLNVFLIFSSLCYLISLSQGAGTPLECPDSKITEATTIRSPLYKEGYFSNFRCWYNITAPEKKRIKVKFTEFSLPPSRVSEHVNYHMSDEGCQTDFVQWWENVNATGDTGRFCGNELHQKTFETVGSELNMVFQSFVTDSNFKGFVAEISFIKKKYSASRNIINAAGTYKMGKIKGENKCTFTVKAPIDKVPHVSPVNIKTEKAAAESKVILIQDNGYGDTLKAETSISKPNFNDKTRKQKNVQLVNFEIDVEGNSDFSGSFQVSFIDPVPYCGGEITGRATLSSQNVPGRILMCTWTIKQKSSSDSMTLEIITNLDEPVKKNSLKLCMRDQVIAFTHDPDPRNFRRDNGDKAVFEPLCGSKTIPVRINKLNATETFHHVTVLSIITLDKEKSKSVTVNIPR